MNHTTNLHLPQWEETDRIQMDDFNDAMQSIDTGVARIMTGSWTGDDDDNRIITLPCTPKLALVFGCYRNDWNMFFILTPEKSCAMNQENCIMDFPGFSLSGNRFIWTDADYGNYNSQSAYYVLIS